MRSDRIIFLEQTVSTNTWLRNLPEADFHHGIVCVADHQTGGRGQGSRVWQSQPGMNLLFSIGLIPSQSDRLILLTLSIAREIAHYLSELTAMPVRLKWPNDLIVGGGIAGGGVRGGKIGGILTETMFRGNRLQRMVIGIGLNINQIEFPELGGMSELPDRPRGGMSELPDRPGGGLQPGAAKAPAYRPVSLAALSGVEWNRESLLRHLLTLIDHALTAWEHSSPDLCSKIHGSLIGYGEWVQVELDERPIGLRKCLGLTAEGELLLLDEQMNVQRFTHEHLRLIPIE